MKLVSLNCTHCGARLPQQKASGTYTCSYCGTQFAAPEPPRPKKSRPKSTPQPATNPSVSQAERTGRPGALRLVSLIGSMLPLMIVGYVVYRVNAPMIKATVPTIRGTVPTIKGTVSALRRISPVRALWDRAGGPALAVQIAGHEAVLGRMRLSDDELFIVATDSATGQPIWQLGPLGTYSEGYLNVYFAVTAKHIVASDKRGTLHVHELESGQEVKQIPLPDRVTNVCTVSPSSVAVAVVDRHHVLLDTTTLSLRAAPLPRGCESQRRSFHQERSPHAKQPSLRGFSMTDAHVEGESGVAAAVKSPGTPTPYAIGFTPGSREIRWQELLPTVDPLSVRATEHDALVGGRYIAVYGVGSSGWHVTALDAKSGTRSWDIELRPLFAVDQIESLLATTDYVYVNRTSSLEILDSKSGKLVGTIGNAPYR